MTHPMLWHGATAVDENDVEIPVLFSVDPADPFAVSIEFYPACVDTVTWKISRELLVEGLFSAEPLGDGDVQVWQDRYETAVIQLTNADAAGARTQYEFQRPELLSWIQHVGTQVPFTLPAGTVEDFLARLLSAE